ncbi:MAG: hypothetical protein H7Y20_16125 [Bryobacteraceae bacterium]|nr:hypothetical protein [Bryobacteraceae bacterium]
MTSLANGMYEGAVSCLRRCCGPEGLRASAGKAGHTQVWTRDAMIALLGASLTEDPVITECLVRSVALLKSLQSPSGEIPNNVDSGSLRPNFRAYADGGLWWIIGSCILQPDPSAIDRVLQWYECQDVDQSGLLSMQESSDWQDLLCTRGKGLYVNCLYVMALEAAAGVLAGERAAECRRKAEFVRSEINRNFWYRGDGNLLPHIRQTFSTENVQELDSLGRKRWIPQKQFLVEERYYLPWLGFRACGEWFDTLGHCVAILAGVADSNQMEIIFTFIEMHGLAGWPAKAIHPQIRPGDPDWREYYGIHNTPGLYHNGGIWPFIGGFYVAALVKAGRLEAAEDALTRLAEINEAGGFNEWHHGDTGEPLGMRDQAWSAGMYIYAHQCVKYRRVIRNGSAENPA